MLRREIRELEDIAEGLDDHIARGEPYGLTFYNGEIDNPTEFITEAQRERLTRYLSYHFRDIWGQWIQAESDRIRKLINKKPMHQWS